MISYPIKPITGLNIKKIEKDAEDSNDSEATNMVRGVVAGD